MFPEKERVLAFEPATDGRIDEVRQRALDELDSGGCEDSVPKPLQRNLPCGESLG